MKTYLLKTLFLVFILAFCAELKAQEPAKKISEMTKEQLMELTYDDLLNLSFEDLILVSDKFGMSADELLDYFLNKEVTSASKRAEKSLNSPLSTTVISKEELEKSGATSIPEALRLVPGMIVREKTNGNYDVHIRGNDNIPANNMFVYSEDAMSLVMIDGRPVYNYAFGGTFWETLPIDVSDIERIEVIRGPSSALYGPNAVAGAINIVTKQVESNKLHFNGQVQAGNYKSTLANLAVTGGVKKLKYRVSGNYTQLGRFEDDYYVFDLNRKLTYEECDTLTYYWDPMKTGMLVFRDSSLNYSDFKRRFTDPEIATKKYGANVYLNYDLNKDISFNLSAGTQNSDIISTPLGNHDIPLVGRLSKSAYVNFNAKLYGFQILANHNQANQQIEKSSIGWRIISQTTNASLEYEHAFGSLVLRPGISFQQALYDDSKYINPSKKEGFLNGEREINALSGFLRVDYKLFDKLRLIAALRADKYNYPNKTYFTYQFISTYDLNDRNVIRAVYSRANRGPFVVDMHADYYWVQVPENDKSYVPTTITWMGNKNLKLPVMDMFELGYRFKPIKNIMVDVEAFYTKTKDFSYFIPDQMSLGFDLSPLFAGQAPSLKSIAGQTRYYNFDINTRQKGLTANIGYVVSNKLTFKVFGTVQETKVNDFYPNTYMQDLSNMQLIDQAQLYGDIAIITKYATNPTSLTPDELNRLGQLQAANWQVNYSSTNPSLVNNKINTDSLVDTYNKSTPTFFGGGTVDYTPFDKLFCYFYFLLFLRE